MTLEEIDLRLAEYGISKRDPLNHNQRKYFNPWLRPSWFATTIITYYNSTIWDNCSGTISGSAKTINSTDPNIVDLALLQFLDEKYKVNKNTIQYIEELNEP